PGMQNKKIRFGDTIRIKDTHFNPPLYLEARVFEQTRSIKSQAKKDIKLGAFTEYTEEELTAIFQRLRYEIQRKIDYYEMEEYTYNRETIDNKDVPGNEAKSKIDTDIGEGTIESTTGSQSKADQAESDANYYTDQIVIPIGNSLTEVEQTLAVAQANIDDTIIRIGDAERDLNEAKGDIGDAVGAITDLETELGNIDIRIGDSEKDLGTAQDDIDRAISDLESLETEIDSKVDAEFVQTYTDEEIRIVRQALEGQISDQIGDVNASISDLQGVADGLTNRVGEVESTLDDHDGKFTNYDVKFDDIEGTFTAHFQEMQRLEGGIEANETLITTTAQGINATINDFQAEYADDKTDILSSIQSNTSEINAMADSIELMVTREEYRTDMDDVDEFISSTTATLGVHADEISARVHQDELTNYVDKQAYNSREAALDVTLDGITSSVSSVEAEIDDLTGEVDSASSKIATLEIDVVGITSTVSDISSDLDSANSAISRVEQRAGSIESTVSSIETVIDGLESDMSSVETRITQLPGEIDLAVSDGIDGLEIGGRNLIQDTSYYSNTIIYGNRGTIVSRDYNKFVYRNSTGTNSGPLFVFSEE